MADIVNPIVIKFMNENLRPLAEQVRDMKVLLDEAASVYTAQIAPLITANAGGDLIEDGRASQGVSRLTKSDLTGFVGIAADLIAALDAAGAMDKVRKPTVRVIRLGA